MIQIGEKISQMRTFRGNNILFILLWAFLGFLPYAFELYNFPWVSSTMIIFVLAATFMGHGVSFLLFFLTSLLAILFNPFLSFSLFFFGDILLIIQAAVLLACISWVARQRWIHAFIAYIIAIIVFAIRTYMLAAYSYWSDVIVFILFLVPQIRNYWINSLTETNLRTQAIGLLLYSLAVVLLTRRLLEAFTVLFGLFGFLFWISWPFVVLPPLEGLVVAITSWLLVYLFSLLSVIATRSLGMQTQAELGPSDLAEYEITVDDEFEAL